MAYLTVRIETERGAALNGIMLKNGRYDTSPCNWPCTSGSGNTISGTTDGNGEVQWSIPYTCVGLWSGTWHADGYIDYVWNQKTGYISGDVGPDGGWTLQMVQTDQAALAEQQGAAALAIANAKAAGKTQAQAQADALAAVQAVQQNKGANWLAGDIANQVSASYTAGLQPSQQLTSDIIGTYWWLLLVFIIVGAIAVFIILRGAKGGGGGGGMTMPAPSGSIKASVKGVGSSLKGVGASIKGKL
jgi:hypothetical protein